MEPRKIKPRKMAPVPQLKTYPVCDAGHGAKTIRLPRVDVTRFGLGDAKCVNILKASNGDLIIRPVKR